MANDCESCQAARVDPATTETPLPDSCSDLYDKLDACLLANKNYFARCQDELGAFRACHERAAAAKRGARAARQGGAGGE